MRKRISAGILLYRLNCGDVEVLLAHPGGPLFAKKDEGHWTIPKGEPGENEELLAVAIREFFEEIGIVVKSPFWQLGWIKQKGGKIVHAWAAETKDLSTPEAKSNLFRMEWPPFSGKLQEFPEVDRADFFTLEKARAKIKEAQGPFLDRLEDRLLRPGCENGRRGSLG